MQSQIHIITLGVRDLRESVRFYRDGLGLPQFKGPPEDEIAFFRLKGTWLSLFPRDKLAAEANVRDSASDFGGFTLGHLVRSPEQVDALLSQAKVAGATITQPGTRREWGGYSGYLSDPNGYLWEIAWMEKPFPID
jgi:uncharacterized protein